MVPADAIGITAAPVYYDYQAIYTYRPESGGKVRTMFFGSGDEFRLNLKQPVDGDPTIRGNLGQGTPFAGCRPSGSAAWARTSSRRSAPASGRLTQDLTAVRRWGSASPASTSSCAPSGARSSART